MHELPTDWRALCVLVFVLGVRHGLDADHLAAIDGFTRMAALRRKAYARYCGVLFSLGHGVVVVGIAAAVGEASQRWATPGWLELTGACVSIVFLLVLGTINLRSVLVTARGQVVPVVGLKGPLARLLPAGNPLAVAATGALFALSFDTISQAAMFAATATQFGGRTQALMLGLLFVLGMLVADGLNGWWMSHLLARADAAAARASRVMGLAVAAVSLLIAGLGLGKLVSPALQGWSDSNGVVLSAAVLLVFAMSYAVARLLAGGRKGRHGSAVVAPPASGRARTA